MLSKEEVIAALRHADECMKADHIGHATDLYFKWVGQTPCMCSLGAMAAYDKNWKLGVQKFDAAAMAWRWADENLDPLLVKVITRMNDGADANDDSCTIVRAPMRPAEIADRLEVDWPVE